MQSTRERILNILKESGQATVDDLSQRLGLTAVTVRHHLDILRGEGLISAPTIHRRKTPGRPQYTYTLAEKANTLFPKRYDALASLILEEMHVRMSKDEVNQLMQHIGQRIAGQAALVGGDLEARLSATIRFLNHLGYMAHWERGENGAYLLYVANCPYEQVAEKDQQVCEIDMALLTYLLGTVPRRTTWAAQGGAQCIYTVQSDDR